LFVFFGIGVNIFLFLFDSCIALLWGLLEELLGASHFSSLPLYIITTTITKLTMDMNLALTVAFFALLFAFVLLCFTIGREAGRVGAFYYSCMRYFSGSGVSLALFIGRTGLESDCW